MASGIRAGLIILVLSLPFTPYNLQLTTPACRQAGTTYNCFAGEVKEPCVAGSFYPAEPGQLASEIDAFLSRVEPKGKDGEAAVLISPHAGYMYSGIVAAYGYKAIQGRQYDTVIIIAPSHTTYFRGISIWPRGNMRTPLGDIMVDELRCAELMQLDHSVQDIPEAFAREHSLEVQLPFLQRVLQGFKIVPLVMGDFDLADCERLSRNLKLIAKDSRTLIVASTDLSHYHPYTKAKEIDAVTIDCIRQLDVERLYQETLLKKAEACGAGPVLVALLYAREFGLKKAEILNYANSGDITGDRSAVVGYASVAIYREAKK